MNTTGAVVTLVLSDLTPFTAYSVTVRAVNSILGELSEDETFSTLEDSEFAMY